MNVPYYKDVPSDPKTESESFKFKARITRSTPAAGNIKDVVIAVPLKFLSNFWRTLEMFLINCKINLVLTWSVNCIITNSTGPEIFTITDTQLYIPVVTLSAQDSTTVIWQLNSGFRRNFYRNKYQSKVTVQDQKHSVDY